MEFGQLLKTCIEGIGIDPYDYGTHYSINISSLLHHNCTLSAHCFFKLIVVIKYHLL